MATEPEHPEPDWRLTGPQHKTEAESLIKMSWQDDRDNEDITQLLARAQVHATLALACAVALNGPGGMLTADEQAWRQAGAGWRPDGA